MQESQQESASTSPKLSFKKRVFLLCKVLGQGRNIWRARKEDTKAEQAEEILRTNLNNLGATEEGITYFKAFLHAWRKARRDDTAFQIVDRYLVGGIGVFDLILFQVLVSVGHPDFAASLSWIAFIISFPCTVGFLFLSFLHKENGITARRGLQSEFSAWSELATLISATALICHIWFVAGLIFFFVTIAVALLCYGYVTVVYLGKHLKLEAADTPLAQQPPETKSADTNTVPESEQNK